MFAHEFESVKDRVVLVTGAGSGLGAATCELLADEGARLIAADIDGHVSHATVGRLKLDEKEALAFTLDVGREDQVSRVLAEGVAHFGRLDAVINNAGIDVTAGIRDLDPADWDRVIRTNLTGPFLVAKHCLRYLAPGGHIINIASTAARRAWPNASAYHASKWGLLGLTHALHAELRTTGIKVSAIIAGGMRTPFLLNRFPDIDTETLQDPRNVAMAVKFILTQPPGTVIPEVMVLPMKETSWP